MLPLRQRAVASLVRRTRPSPSSVRTPRRSYASDSHGKGGDHSHGHHDAHHAPHAVEEPLGSYFWYTIGTVPLVYIVYSLSQPGKDGEQPALTRFMAKYSDMSNRWEVENARHTAWIAEVGRDRLLFNHALPNYKHDVRMPELISAGPPVNVPAGHYINTDKIVEYYRKEHLDMEARKLQRLAEEEKANKS